MTFGPVFVYIHVGREAGNEANGIDSCMESYNTHNNTAVVFMNTSNYALLLSLSSYNNIIYTYTQNSRKAYYLSQNTNSKSHLRNLDIPCICSTL